MVFQETSDNVLNENPNWNENTPATNNEDDLSSFELNEDPFQENLDARDIQTSRLNSWIVSVGGIPLELWRYLQRLYRSISNRVDTILAPIIPERYSHVRAKLTPIVLCLTTIPCFIGCIILFICMFIIVFQFLEFIPNDPESRAKYIADRYILIDTHNDWPNKIERLERLLNREIDLRKRMTEEDRVLYESLNEELHTDIPRMREGKLRGQFWSVFASCYASDPVQESYRQFEMVYELLDRYPEDLIYVQTSSEMRDKFSSSKKIVSLIGVEGGHLLGKGDRLIQILRAFYRLGARYLTLTHSCDTEWAKHSSSTREGPGLTQLGKEIVLEMNRLGMMIDLSHTHPDTMRDTLSISKAPVIFSHSGALEICNHSRNVPNDIIDQLIEKDGVIMINYYTIYVNEKSRLKYNEIVKNNPGKSYTEIFQLFKEWEKADPENNEASIKDVCDHIDYIKRRMKTSKHIGIGADYDGVTLVPRGLEDVSKHYMLGAELFRRGYSDEEVIGIFGGNLLRVMEKIEQVSKQISSTQQKHKMGEF